MQPKQFDSTSRPRAPESHTAFPELRQRPRASLDAARGIFLSAVLGALVWIALAAFLGGCATPSMPPAVVDEDAIRAMPCESRHGKAAKGGCQ